MLRAGFSTDLIDSTPDTREWGINYRAADGEGLEPNGWVVLVQATPEEILDTSFTFFDDEASAQYEASPIDPALIEIVEQIEERTMEGIREDADLPTPWEEAGVTHRDFL